MAQTERGATLTIFAVLFAILAVSNLLKPFQIGEEATGFVLFGTRLAGTPNVIAVLYLRVYACGIWNSNASRSAWPTRTPYTSF